MHFHIIHHYTTILICWGSIDVGRICFSLQLCLQMSIFGFSSSLFDHKSRVCQRDSKMILQCEWDRHQTTTLVALNWCSYCDSDCAHPGIQLESKLTFTIFKCHIEIPATRHRHERSRSTHIVNSLNFVKHSWCDIKLALAFTMVEGWTVCGWMDTSSWMLNAVDVKSFWRILSQFHLPLASHETFIISSIQSSFIHFRSLAVMLLNVCDDLK